jgi:hypothetical protein
VLIDANGQLIGFNVYVLKNILQKYGSRYSKIVYWDQYHSNMELSVTGDNSPMAWDKVNSPSIFYFYDHTHTTGIDALLPSDIEGVIIVKPMCIYRDFVQSAFRLRQLGSQKLSVYYGGTDVRTLDEFKAKLITNAGIQYVSDSESINKHMIISKYRDDHKSFNVDNEFSYKNESMFKALFKKDIQFASRNALQQHMAITTDEELDVDIEKSREKKKAVGVNSDQFKNLIYTNTSITDMYTNALKFYEDDHYVFLYSKISLLLTQTNVIIHNVVNNRQVFMIAPFFDYVILCDDKSSVYSFSGLLLSGSPVTELESESESIYTICNAIIGKTTEFSEEERSFIRSKRYGGVMDKL